MNNQNNVWENPEIIEIEDELKQEKVDGFFALYTCVPSGGCDRC